MTNIMTRPILLPVILYGLLSTINIAFGMELDKQNIQPNKTLFVQSKKNHNYYEVVARSSDPRHQGLKSGYYPSPSLTSSSVLLSEDIFDKSTIELITTYKKENQRVFLYQENKFYLISDTPTENILNKTAGKLTDQLNNNNGAKAKITPRDNAFCFVIGGSVIIGIMSIFAAYKYNVSFSQFFKNLIPNRPLV